VFDLGRKSREREDAALPPAVQKRKRVFQTERERKTKNLKESRGNARPQRRELQPHRKKKGEKTLIEKTNRSARRWHKKAKQVIMTGVYRKKRGSKVGGGKKTS